MMLSKLVSILDTLRLERSSDVELSDDSSVHGDQNNEQDDFLSTKDEDIEDNAICYLCIENYQ